MKTKLVQWTPGDIPEYRDKKLWLHFADGNLWIDGPEVTCSWHVNDVELKHFLSLANKHTSLKDTYGTGSNEGSFLELKFDDLNLLIGLRYDQDFMFEIFHYNMFVCFHIQPKKMKDFISFLEKEVVNRFLNVA